MESKRQELLDLGWMPVPIPKFAEYYMIHRDGFVYSLRRDRLVNPVPDTYGYDYIRLSLKGVDKRKPLHRLIAMAFIKKTGVNQKQVNHKDLDKKNNHWENLEWVTAAVNSQHRVANGGGIPRKKKPLIQ